VRLTVALLLAAVGLLIAALSTDRVALAWGSVAISVLVAAIIIRRWRRSWLQRRDSPEDESVLLSDGSITGSGTAEQQTSAAPLGEPQSDIAQDPPGEEDTDAADLLVVYELIDEVLVVDEQPRYHLPRCPLPDQEHAEQLPVREARELGFTPCDQCRPDKALARKHRAAGATAAGS
jgi:hypothetical protein